MSLRRDDEVFVVCAYSHPSHSETVKKSSLRVMGWSGRFIAGGLLAFFFVLSTVSWTTGLARIACVCALFLEHYVLDGGCVTCVDE